MVISFLLGTVIFNRKQFVLIAAKPNLSKFLHSEHKGSCLLLKMNDNHNLIQRIISSNADCPAFVYQNPLLDKNVAKALSKSFIKILKISSQNTSTNNNLRRSILENIRKFCTVQPEGHATVDDGLSELLTELYQLNIGEGPSNVAEAVDRQLDAYLVRRLKNLDIKSKFESTVNPETIQALMNLSENGVHFDILASDVINWNSGLNKQSHLLKMFFGVDNVFSEDLTDDICIKMKPQIEMLLLNVCSKMLATRDQNVQEILTANNDLKELMKMCSKSKECFQMCCGILNFLFIMTNFDTELQRFIPEFVKGVKSICGLETSVTLYSYHLSTCAILLDFDVNRLPEPHKVLYIEQALYHLNELHKRSENEVILLLSHYPQWFDIYFSNAKA